MSSGQDESKALLPPGSTLKCGHLTHSTQGSLRREAQDGFPLCVVSRPFLQEVSSRRTQHPTTVSLFSSVSNEIRCRNHFHSTLLVVRRLFPPGSVFSVVRRPSPPRGVSPRRTQSRPTPPRHTRLQELCGHLTPSHPGLLLQEGTELTTSETCDPMTHPSRDVSSRRTPSLSREVPQPIPPGMSPPRYHGFT